MRVETLPMAGLASLLSTIAAEGWTLVAAFPHPYETLNAEPLIITIWRSG